jgi:hypothetical protein
MKIKYRNVVYEVMNVSKNQALAWVQQSYNTLIVKDSHKLVYANYNLWEVSVVEAVKRLEKNNKGKVKRNFSNGKKVLEVEVDDSISEKALEDLIPRMVTYQEVQSAFKKRFRKIRNLLARKKKEKEIEDMYKEGLNDAKSYAEKYPKEDIKSRQFFWFFNSNMIEVEVEK